MDPVIILGGTVLCTLIYTQRKGKDYVNKKFDIFFFKILN